MNEKIAEWEAKVDMAGPFEPDFLRELLDEYPGNEKSELYIFVEKYLSLPTKNLAPGLRLGARFYHRHGHRLRSLYRNNQSS